MDSSTPLFLALIAVGFSITFGISRVANFAYGGFYVLGGMLAWFFLVKLGLPYFLAAILAVIIVGVLGAIMYRLLLARLRGLELSEVISTFAIGLIILEMLRSMGVMGFDYRLPPFVQGSVEIFGYLRGGTKAYHSGRRWGLASVYLSFCSPHQTGTGFQGCGPG